MQTNDSFITTTQAAEFLKMPIPMLRKWMTDGTLEGIKHPEFKIKSGWSRLYSKQAVEDAAKALSQDVYFPQPSVELNEWTGSDAKKYGCTALLACALKSPVQLRVRSGDVYEISKADKIKTDSISATELINRGISNIDTNKNIVSRFDFPGIQFKVKKVK